ncbi:MAG: histidine--tRNA ligase [Bdellovibrionales bacterium]
MALSTKPYKGTRDFYPEDMYVQKWMFENIAKTVEGFGYQPYDGPMLEPFELYAAKSGQEIVEKQLYWFTDRGERKVAIRPEMTPTMARMVAGKVMELPKPVRWYSIPNLWRYERPQRGRLREHWQLNVDVLGGDNLFADAEILKLAHAVIAGFGGEDKIRIAINNRKLINHVFKNLLKLDADAALKASKAVDARDKIGEEAYLKLLAEAGLNSDQTSTMENFFKSDLETVCSDFDCEGARELNELFSVLKDDAISSVLKLEPQIMRGLDYYTGTVFEVYDVSPENNRAMFGGGRYDNLIGLFGNQQLSGVGFGMGDVTLRNFLESHNLLPELKSHLDVFFVTANRDAVIQSEKLASDLRKLGIKCASSLSTAKFNQQLKQANKLNAKIAVIIGESELENQQLTLKDLVKGEQTSIATNQLTSHLKSMLPGSFN